MSLAMKLFTKTDTSDSQDCLPCLLHSKYDPFYSLYSLRFYCKHSKCQYSVEPRCTINKFLRVIEASSVIFLVVTSIIYWMNVPTVCTNTDAQCLVFVADQIFITSGTILAFWVFWSLQIQELETNCWIKIFEERSAFDLDPIVRGKDVKKFAIKRGSFLTIALWYCVLGYLYFGYPFEGSQWTFKRKFVIIMSYGLQFYGISEVDKAVFVVGLLLKALANSLKKHLKDRPTRLTLKPLQTFISTLSRVIGLTMIFMGTLMFVWSIVAVVTLIINIYILIRYHEYDRHILRALQLRTFATIGWMSAVLFRTEKSINRRCADMLSFLFKWPISKLTVAEAAQVEVLITTLIVHKPVLRTTGVLTIGTRLLASISGIVVTYVLVALQFRAPWAN